ncbi:hypothetical protein [Ruegeria intermedia]|uniref:hypothetical protein n=1 Tax=Ruegeria intermedia TaxID=996115 RepID=UPI00165F52C7|nr:hypothetical protein [Ruegeria intermedia]
MNNSRDDHGAGGPAEQFYLCLPDGTLSGHQDIIKTYSNATREIITLGSLQVAVGMPSLHEPEWVFLDQNSDLSGITRHNVSYDTGISVAAVDGVIATDMASIPPGNREAP